MCNGRGAHGKSLWKRKYARTPAELKDNRDSMFFCNSTCVRYIRFVGEMSGYVYEFFINFDEESLGVMVKTLILASIDIKS